MPLDVQENAQRNKAPHRLGLFGVVFYPIIRYQREHQMLEVLGANSLDKKLLASAGFSTDTHPEEIRRHVIAVYKPKSMPHIISSDAKWKKALRKVNLDEDSQNIANCCRELLRANLILDDFEAHGKGSERHEWKEQLEKSDPSALTKIQNNALRITILTRFISMAINSEKNRLSSGVKQSVRSIFDKEFRGNTNSSYARADIRNKLEIVGVAKKLAEAILLDFKILEQPFLPKTYESYLNSH